MSGVPTMNFLSLSDLTAAFSDLDQASTIQDLMAVRPFMISVMPESVVLNICASIEALDFDAFITAFHESDEHGVTWFDHLDLSDMPDHLLKETQDSALNLKKLIELVELYEVLENNNYSGMDLESVAFIAESYFEQYMRDCQVEEGSVANHLVDYVDWSTFAHNVRNADYGAVKVNAPHTLQIEDADYFYRK